MTMYSRSSRWAAALALGVAGLIGGGAATAPAAPAGHAASAFELTLVAPEFTSKGTFSSRAPFCRRGTFVDLLVVRTTPIAYRRLTCEDGSGSLTISFGTTEAWRPWGASWEIFDGSGSYERLRGRGFVRGEVLGDKIDALLGGTVAWRSTLEGVVERDAVAPTIILSRATVTKLRRPAGAFSIRLALALHDDVDGHPVSYTLRVAARGGTELARRFGTTTKPTLPLTLRVNPPDARAKGVWLELYAEDPIGNPGSLICWLKLPAERPASSPESSHITEIKAA
jgi:hypothetical protein